MKNLVLIFLFVSASTAFCQPLKAKFLPPEGKTMFIVGQDLGAIGGFPAPNDNGYYENVATNPAGVTTYISLPSLGGMSKLINYGGGDACAQCIVDNPKYMNTTLSIGLYMVGQLESINQGKQDDKIAELARFIQNTNRPVFLRIGYEFDGNWNHYEPTAFKKAWIRIKDTFDSLQVKNCATVWQACTSPVDESIEGKHENLMDWYPGDEYVDWMAYSWFLNNEVQYKLTDELLELAKEHNKPVMVAEATPQGYDLNWKTKRNIGEIVDGPSGENMKNRKPAEIWEEWFEPFLDYIYKHEDQIKAVAYINVNWDSQGLWGAPYAQGYWGDSRIETNRYILKEWKEEMAKDVWLHGSSNLFEQLGFQRESGRGGYRR